MAIKKTSHWADLGEWSFVWGMRFLLKVYLLLGRRVLQCFLYPVVSYYWLVNTEGRAASRAYLKRVARALPGSGITGSLNDSYRHFLGFANALIDKLAAWSGALRLSNVELIGRENLLEELKKGRGVLMLVSHLGNLEVCRVIAELDVAIKINVLVHTKHAQKFNSLMAQTNAKSSLNLLQVTEINATTAMLLYDKIESGELVIIAADRTPVTHQQRVSQAGFLGDTACFPEGPFILASLLQCPVYTLFCLKRMENYVIYFEHFCDSLALPRKNRQQALQQAAQRYAERLERYCLTEPLQWFNFYDFWRSHES